MNVARKASSENAMPSSDEILYGLSQITNDWKVLAVVWHVYYCVVAVFIFVKKNVATRLAALLLMIPFMSVSALAWTNHNPFNALMFALLSIVLVTFSIKLPNQIHFASPGSFILGGLLFLFGWSYPHFLKTDSGWTYLYAAPLGLIPCPTLSATVGLSLILNGFRHAPWMLTLGVAALLYSLYGVFRLHVLIDAVLLLGGTMSLICSFSRTRTRAL